MRVSFGQRSRGSSGRTISPGGGHSVVEASGIRGAHRRGRRSQDPWTGVYEQPFAASLPAPGLALPIGRRRAHRRNAEPTLLGRGSPPYLLAMKRCKDVVVLTVAAVAVALAIPSVSGARPNPDGLVGPASGAGVAPGAGFGAAGPGLDRQPGVGAGGVGGPVSGAGVLPGAGLGEAGPGLERRPVANPGGVGGPASGAGVRPGVGYGAPGAGMYRH
jgi:hypothetical protein